MGLHSERLRNLLIRILGLAKVLLLHHLLVHLRVYKAVWSTVHWLTTVHLRHLWNILEISIHLRDLLNLFIALSLLSWDWLLMSCMLWLLHRFLDWWSSQSISSKLWHDFLSIFSVWLILKLLIRGKLVPLCCNCFCEICDWLHHWVILHLISSLFHEYKEWSQFFFLAIWILLRSICLSSIALRTLKR